MGLDMIFPDRTVRKINRPIRGIIMPHKEKHSLERTKT